MSRFSPVARRVLPDHPDLLDFVDFPGLQAPLETTRSRLLNACLMLQLLSRRTKSATATVKEANASNVLLVHRAHQVLKAHLAHPDQRAVLERPEHPERMVELDLEGHLVTRGLLDGLVCRVEKVRAVGLLCK